MARDSDPEQELSDKVERLYVEYASVHGPPPPCPAGFPPEDDAERKRLAEAERQVFEHVAWHGRLPEKLTDEQRWLLECWIDLRPLIEDRSPYKAIAHRYVGGAIERELETSESARDRGHKRTYLRGIQALVDGLAKKHQGDSVEKLWRRAWVTYFRSDDEDHNPFAWDRGEVYHGRDAEGEKVLIQEEEFWRGASRVSRETPLRRRSFRPYVERAKGERPR